MPESAPGGLPPGRSGAAAECLRRFEELEKLLYDPAVASDPGRVRTLAKEHASLKPMVQRLKRLEVLRRQIEEAEGLITAGDGGRELAELAQAELSDLRRQAGELERQVEADLLPKDPDDEKSVIVEIRAGAGGAEASLFAADLHRMYGGYAARRGWRIEPMSSSATELGGFKEVIFAVEGEGVYREMKFERGVHRVQRVPATEASGRIHTSTVTVAVLPQAEAVEVDLDPKDLRIDVFRSSGPGGQGVNTTDSAVRITHNPTGLVVCCQDERSQLKNRAKAMKVLQARLMEIKTREQISQRTDARRAQIGGGERSEKIRTYNFPDRRVTDHRVGLTSHRLEEILDGSIEEFIVACQEAQRRALLERAQ
ncbi:MAG: peptide chain release factor 1 [Candidatus Omnitrophica bacterium CG11_big_fil_rev_8_21_14_0_20_64_10]|nr:MAG: peptide chain release factor 1 [Candidatus Omnitrophica bacterium CG11_big_fil_rev_8_21_14_0_20_64_10]